MKNVKIVQLNEDYYNYLRKFDKRVCINHDKIRPYMGGGII